MVAPPSVESARTVAIASPIVALATTTTTGLLLGTLGIIVPLTAISADAELLTRALAVPGMDAVPGISLGDAMRKRGYDEQKREARKMQRKDFKSGGASLSNA